jgi:hypothetical protein
MMMMTLTTLLTLMASCQRRPLYIVEDTGVKVIVKVLWKVDTYPEGLKPDGVTMYFFRDGKFLFSESTANVDSCAFQLDPGRYRLYMISQSPDEFGHLEFFDMFSSWGKARVSVPEVRSRWYAKAQDEVLIDNPDLMVAGVSEEFEVTEYMVEEYQHYSHTLMSLESKAGGPDPTRAHAEEMVNYYTIRVPIRPRNIVSQFWVTIYSDNADVLRSVRASTSGMARDFMLVDDKTGDGEGTQLITDWSLTIDDPIRRVGHLDGKITTFGFPRGEQPSPARDSTLNVATLLVDNSTVEYYVFNVGDKITPGDPPIGYRSLYRLVFGSVEKPEIHPPDVPPGGEPSGFDATVDDWEEGESVDVSM